MIRFLQINLNRCRTAQDLLWQHLREERVDVAVISEQYRDPSPSVGWSPDAAGDAAVWTADGSAEMRRRETSFVAVRWRGIVVFSVYISPNITTEEFLVTLDRLEHAVRGEARGGQQVLVAGDFNARSAEWGDRVTSGRGRAISDLCGSLDLTVLNRGSTPTFERGDAQSVIDLTMASRSLSGRVSRWRVERDRFVYSDHNVVRYDITEQGTTRPSRPPPTHRVTRWVISSFDADMFVAYLSGVTTLDGNTAARKARQLHDAIKAGCNLAMRTCRSGGGSDARPPPVHWWTPEIAELRTKCQLTRRRLQREKRRHAGAATEATIAEYRQAKKTMRNAISSSKKRCWLELCATVETDPWGKPYRIVRNKLRRPSPVTGDSAWMDRIVAELFPPAPARTESPPPTTSNETHTEPSVTFEEVTEDEVLAAAGRINGRKAPGMDGLPGVAVKAAALARPDLFRELYNRCLLEGRIPGKWKRQRLVLVSKPRKAGSSGGGTDGGADDGAPATAFRPLCMLDFDGKLFEKIIVGRLRAALERPAGAQLSDRQYGFRQGRSTLDAVNEVLAKARGAIGGPLRTAEHCVIVALDVRNAFNTASWARIIRAVQALDGVEESVVRVLRDYLRGRTLHYDTLDGCRRRAMRAGVPQGSVLGPTLWNIMYDGVLRMAMPEGTDIIAYADDLVVMARARQLRDVVATANAAVRRVQEWLEGAGLQLAANKTEAILVTRRKTIEHVSLQVGDAVVRTQRAMSYLGVTLDSRLSFREHFHHAAEKASRVQLDIARLMPNVGAPRQSARALLTTVVSSVLLYGAPVWADALKVAAYRKVMVRPYRAAMLRVACAYRTVSTDALSVITGMPPIDLLAAERKRRYVEMRAGEGGVRTGALMVGEGLAEWQRR